MELSLWNNKTTKEANIFLEPFTISKLNVLCYITYICQLKHENLQNIIYLRCMQ